MRFNILAKIQRKVPQRCESELSIFMLFSISKLLKKYRDLCLHGCRQNQYRHPGTQRPWTKWALDSVLTWGEPLREADPSASICALRAIGHSVQKLSSKVTKCPIRYLSCGIQGVDTCHHSRSIAINQVKALTRISYFYQWYLTSNT